jgi:hypothetical protein
MMFRFAICLALVSCCKAASVSLAWDPSTDPEVTGAIVYYGNASRNYPWHTNAVGTNATVLGLGTGKTWYFAVTATNTAGLESDYSNEVSSAIPVPPPRNLVLRSGVESAPTPIGPWTEMFTTRLPITVWDSNLFFRPSINLTNPPMP